MARFTNCRECNAALTPGDEPLCDEHLAAFDTIIRASFPHIYTKQPATTEEQAWIDKGIGPRVVGGTYRNGYWSDTYTVEAIYRAPDASQWGMRVRWSDGHTTVHSTAWNAKRDSVVATATVPERAPGGMLAVRVGSDPWVMVPLDEATNPVGWDVIDTSTD